MSFFLLPEVHSTINNITLESNEMPEVYISPTLSRYLNKIKQQLDESYDTWDFYKKYTNPYEFIHTIIPNTKCSVSKLKPLSRSFYKMIEIVNQLDLFSQYKSHDINTFHLAEGPGGFIEAIAYLRNNQQDNYYGMTLIDPDVNVPGWKKSCNFLDNHKNVVIETGVTGTGDLLEVDNLKHCYSTYNNKMEIITADGGFDFSIDFNQQETLATKLLFAQVSFAIAMQKKNGHFVLKIFDIFTKTTSDIIYLLSTLYKQVFILKPNTSRLANSEKYIICKFFKGDKSRIMNHIIREYPKMKTINHISSILNFELDYYYSNKIEEYNAIFGQQQIENINSTLTLFSCKNKNEKIESLKKNFIQKCIQWCEKYNIPYNNTLANHNIFLNIS
jgi:23S rRNA U2552 (ribose-2'-O)-methylase RlmE/FtsJ